MIGAATVVYMTTIPADAAENTAKIMQRKDIGVAVINVVDYGRFEEKSSPAAQSSDRNYLDQASLTGPSISAQTRVN